MSVLFLLVLSVLCVEQQQVNHRQRDGRGSGGGGLRAKAQMRYGWCGNCVTADKYRQLDRVNPGCG